MPYTTSMSDESYKFKKPSTKSQFSRTKILHTLHFENTGCFFEKKTPKYFYTLCVNLGGILSELDFSDKSHIN